MHAAEPDDAQRTCSTALDREQIHLPSDLKLKSEAVDYAAQNPEDRGLLVSLYRIFAQLTSADEDLTDLQSALSERSDQIYGGSDFAQHPYFKNRDDLVTGPVLENYAQLIQSPWRRRLGPNDLGILAFLLRNIPKNSGDAKFRVRPAVSFDNLAPFESLLRILKNKRYRAAAAALLKSREGQSYFLGAWNAYAVRPPTANRVKFKYVRSALSPTDLDEIADQVLRGQSNLEIAALFEHYVNFLHAPLGMYRLEWLNRFPFDLLDTEDGMTRRNVLDIAAHFLAENIQVRSSLAKAIEILDHQYFGTPLPLSNEEFFREIVENAKRVIAPIKNAYAEHKSILEKTRVRPPAPSSSIQYDVIDYFKPVQNLAVRASKEAKEIEPVQQTVSIENLIPPATSLRAFTSFSHPPQPLTALRSETEYRFWFLRDEAPRMQKVQLSSPAIVWILAHPTEGRDLLDSLHLGRARINFQSGIKMLGRRSPFIDGSLFEIKIASGNRGLLYSDRGTWMLVSVVGKSSLDRAIENLKPFGD